MKKMMKKAFFLIGLLIFIVVCAGKMETQAAEKVHTNNLKGVKQVVLVTTSSKTDSDATVRAYEYSEKEGVWVTKKKTAGRVGKNGIDLISSRKQGSGKTPQGILKLTGAFGKKENPGTLFSYTKITNKMYWNLNSGSNTYNQLVYKNPGGEYEHLIDYNTYNYMVTTDYNIEQIAGKGGAIFFHCNGKGATAGCISVEESVMKWYMKWLDPEKNPVIIVTTSDNVQKYFVPAAKITSVAADSADSLKIKWNRVYGTNRYYIQRAESKNGKYTTVKTITDPSVTSWTDKTIEKGKVYYYRIKTRNYIDGNIGYTGTSNVVCNKVFKVVYEANKGSGKMSSTWVPYGYNTKLRKSTFTRSGYTQVGWYAYRVSDKKWLTKDHGWQTASTISKKNYAKKVYANQSYVSKASSVNKDTIKMYAAWKKK